MPVTCKHKAASFPFRHFPLSSTLSPIFPAIPPVLFSITSTLFHFLYPTHLLSFLSLAHSFQKTGGYPLLCGMTNRSISEFSPDQSLPAPTTGHHSRVATRGLPKLNRIAFGVVEAGEAAVGVSFGVEGDFYARGAELGEHGFEIGHAEVDHPLKRLRRSGVAEIAGVGGEGCEGGGAGLRLPGRVVVVGGDGGNAEMRGVPGGESLRIARAEEESADAKNFFHGASKGGREEIPQRTQRCQRERGEEGAIYRALHWAPVAGHRLLSAAMMRACGHWRWHGIWQAVGGSADRV